MDGWWVDATWLDGWIEEKGGDRIADPWPDICTLCRLVPSWLPAVRFREAGETRKEGDSDCQTKLWSARLPQEGDSHWDA